MSELRFDPIRRRWTIIATERRLRPHEFAVPRPAEPADFGACPFEHGSEPATPPEIASYPGGAEWQVRVVPNKYPAVSHDGPLAAESSGLFRRLSGVGSHEVIVETPEHHRDMADMAPEEIAAVLRVWRDRLQDLRSDRRLRYVLLFKNHGREAGASLAHPHSQLLATSVVPEFVKDELASARAHYRRTHRCIFCELIDEELARRERVVLAHDGVVALSPWAALFPFETWLLPRAHSHDFGATPDSDLLRLATALRDLLRRLSSVLADPAFNLILHTAPLRRPTRRSTDATAHSYHWHLELIPRISHIAGFEWGSGYSINHTTPEEAARYLREAVANP
jgi:UDPglucose--hexose-1-phosphate uridylyltransferase